MRHAVIVLAAVSCLSVFLPAQTADELVNKNIEAKGGRDKIKAVKSVRMTGKLNAGGGFTAAETQENQRPNLVRETFSLQGMTAVTAYDGTTGWQIQPFGGKKDPELMGEDDLKDRMRKQLEDLAAKCDGIRSKIVATKEGGMVTGEERIRELLGQLYGTVNGYEGRPADYQAARADSLAHELEDVSGDFQKLTQKELSGINAGLKKKKVDAISVLTEAEWQKKREAEGSSGSGAGKLLMRNETREID
jgi:hypothetical protein